MSKLQEDARSVFPGFATVAISMACLSSRCDIVQVEDGGEMLWSQEAVPIGSATRLTWLSVSHSTGLWRLVTASEMARWCEMCFKAKGEVDCFWGMPVRLVGQSWQTEQPDHCIKHLERTCQLDLICIASPCKYWHDIHDLSLSIRSEPAACDDMWWPASILRRLAQHKVSIWKLMLELALNTVSQYHYYAESTSQVRVF